MRPQTKININRKETRIFGAVYERVYYEILNFSFQSLKSVNFDENCEVSENRVRSRKFKNQEA